MINWASKLTSRKFLESFGAFVSMLIIAFHGTQELAAQVAAIIMVDMVSKRTLKKQKNGLPSRLSWATRLQLITCPNLNS